MRPKSNVKTTPADGGANISRSQESKSHVVAANASPEVLAVVEPPKQDEMPASGGSDEIALIPTISTQGAPMQQLKTPPLEEGEIYIGVLGDKSGDVYHVILLPGDNDEAEHQAQLEWAKSIGGDLPGRIEQSMLWANHRDQFKKDWYWSNEDHHSVSGYAWCQHFSTGNQNDVRKNGELRARAVRRLPI